MLSKTPNRRYIPGLDGLRALAVLTVIAYHFNFSWAKGGFLGVDIFFVLSGYLITSTILPIQGNHLTLNLREFWFGRIRRLLPAAYFMIMTVLVWVMLFNRELLNTVRGDAISSIFYTSNWWFIFHKLSYFDIFGSPSPLKNLWSLAIEEQFYFIWPIALTVGLSIFKNRSKLSIAVFLVALSSAILMSILYHPGTDPSRVYYGTDTRLFELLIGCSLALIWPMKRLSSKKLSAGLSNTLNITSMIAFGIFIICIFLVDEYQVFLYRGGLLLVCINAAILIACVCHPASFLGNLLSWKPLRWIGSRSYGIYIWHYPVTVLGTPVQEIGNPVFWRVGLQLAIILIIAEFSYRFIETPIRKNGFRPFFRQYLAINIINWRSFPLARKVSTVLIPLILLMFTAGITGVVKGEEKKESIKSYPAQVKINDDRPSSKKVSKQGSHTLEKDSADQSSEKKSAPKIEQSNEPKKEENLTANKAYTGILGIGDSVMIDIAPSLHKIYPTITIDAKVGRQVSQAANLAPGYAAFNHPDKAVIIQLGTNGYFSTSQIDTLLNAFSDAHIYLITVRVPRPWESKVNDALYEKARDNDNITMVDWYSTAINHPEYFTADGVHLEPKGVEALTNLIDQSINDHNGK